jgi:PUB domain
MSIDAAFEDRGSAWEKCARMLPLNTSAELADLQELLGTVCRNVVENPEELKYRTIRLGNKVIESGLVSRKGGMEFLRAAGFKTRSVEDKKVLQLDEKEDGVEIMEIEEAVSWLNSTVDSCLRMAEMGKRKSTDCCAECIIHLRLPTGATVAGGFMKTDLVSSVLSFACCFFQHERAEDIRLRQTHKATEVISGEELEQTLEQFGLCPRATLVVSLLSEEARKSTMNCVFVKVAVDLKEQKEKAERTRYLLNALHAIHDE